MTGVEHHGHVGALGLVAEVLQGAAHAVIGEVGLQADIEVKAVQRLRHVVSIVDRIGELLDGLIGRIANDQRHSPACRSGHRKRDQRQELE